MRKLKIVLCLVLSTVFVCPWGWAAVDHVVLVSFDGFRPDVISKFKNKLPHFHQLMDEGAFTLNARTDADYTVTLPNHTCMLTSRGVAGAAGHGVILNTDTTKTIHQLKGSYVKSIFDVLREHKLPSAMYASKIKFQIYAASYPIDDVHLTDQNDAQTMESVGKILKGDRLPAFLFVHFSGTDKAGHKHGWSLDARSGYMQAAFQLDDYLGQIMTAIKTLNARGISTVLIATSDHGGSKINHADSRLRCNYTIPFLVWGAHVAHGKDLYQLNKTRRMDPGQAQVPYRASVQPIRNGEAANLSLRLLGLPCVSQSTIGCTPGLVVEETDVADQK